MGQRGRSWILIAHNRDFPTADDPEFASSADVENAAREAAYYAASSAPCRSGGATCAGAGVTNAAQQEVGTDATMTVASVTCTPACSLSSGTSEYRVTVVLSRPFPLLPSVSDVPGNGGGFFPVFTLGATATAVIQ